MFITFFKNNFPHQSTPFQHSFHYRYFYCNCFIFNFLSSFYIYKISNNKHYRNFGFQHIDTLFLSSFTTTKRSIMCGIIFYNFRHKYLVIHDPVSSSGSYIFDGFLRKIFVKNY